VHLARRLEVDAESALRAEAASFVARFASWEKTTDRGDVTPWP